MQGHRAILWTSCRAMNCAPTGARPKVESAIQKTGLRMTAVYLHGSHGTEYMRDDSAIDIAFLSERPLTFRM